MEIGGGSHRMMHVRTGDRRDAPAVSARWAAESQWPDRMRDLLIYRHGPGIAGHVPAQPRPASS